MITAMGRTSTGRVDARPTRDDDTAYSIRVTDPMGGQQGRPRRPRITLGLASNGWTMEMAEARLGDTMAALRLGVDLYVLFPSVIEADGEADTEPTLATLGERYVADAKSRKLTAKTIEHREWINGHAMPHIGDLRVSEVSGPIVDTLRDRLIAHRDMIVKRSKTDNPVMVTRKRASDGATWKQRAQPLNDGSINRVLVGVAALIDWAMVTQENVEERHNPASSKHRRLVVPAVDSRSYLEPDQVLVYLRAARQYERAAQRSCGAQAALAEAEVSVLVMGALRISEMCWAERSRVNVGAGHMIAGRKTAAGRNRKIALVFDALTDVLTNVLANHTGGQWLFEAHGGKGKRRSPRRVARMLDDIWELAGPIAASEGVADLERVTPHMLRRTNISLLCAAGYPPGWVARQVGHKDPKLTQRIYDQVLQAQQAETHRVQANKLLGVRLAQQDAVVETVADVVPAEWSEA